jgi:hypothetical protein
MSKFQESIICVGCGAEITWGPLLKQEQPYCCEDCSNGLPCECATRQEWDPEGQPTTSASAPGEQFP